jgi:hypothetical protein
VEYKGRENEPVRQASASRRERDTDIGAPFGVFRAGNKDAPDGTFPDSRIGTTLSVFPGCDTQ